MKPQFDALAEAQGLTATSAGTNGGNKASAEAGGSSSSSLKESGLTKEDIKKAGEKDEFCFDNLLETFQDPEFQSFLTTMLNHNVPEGSKDKA